jgi:anti-sigma-K factor RskA
MNADVHALAGAYAMDALPPEEAREFAQHLQQCPACQQETAELQITAAQLGIAVTSQPPPALRDRVLRAVQQVRQVPPPTSADDISSRRRRTRTQMLVAAAAVVLVLAAGLLALRPVLDDTADSPQQDRIVAVMNAADARSSTTTVSGGGSMTVVSSRRLDEAVVLGERLPRLDRAHDYQLWLVDPAGNARSARVLIDGVGAPSTGSRLVRGLRPGDQVAITQEPAGGSEQPTTAPLAITRRT